MIALEALGWILSDADRAHRFLDVTGLTPDLLRQAVGETSVHMAVMDFLRAHEPDLIAAAAHIGMAPEKLAMVCRGENW